MSTPSPETKPRTRRRRKAVKQPKLQTRLAPCGREVAHAGHFFAIEFACGAVLWQSYAALSRSACPDCLIDQLRDHRYVEYGDPLRATFSLDGDGRVGPYGAFNGLMLAGHLARLSTPGSLDCSHLIDIIGEC